MTKYILSLLWFVCFTSVASAAESHVFNKIDLEHIEGGGVGYSTGYTTLKGFFSKNPCNSDTIPFLDLRGHIFDNGRMAANIGLGLRWGEEQRIYGVYAFYDYRNTQYNSYNQFSLGLETIGNFLDARVNAYLPFGKHVSNPYDVQFGMFSGNSLFLFQKNEYVLQGLDAEVGWHIIKDKLWQTDASAGPYYYHNRYGNNVLGAMAKFKITYKEFIGIEIAEHYDNLFRNNTQVMISLTFPYKKSFADNKNCSAYDKIIQPVSRSEIIPVNDVSVYANAINPLTGLPYHFIFVDNTSHSDGSYESPYHSLAQAQANSQPGQIIYVFPGDGTTTNMDHGITLQDNQKLWGTGSMQQIDTTNGYVTIPQLTNTNPQITNTILLGPGVLLAKNNEISGVTISQTSGQGIYGTDVNSFSLSNSVLTGNGQGDLGIFPISLISSSPLNATFDNNNFTNNTNGGIYIELRNGATISDIKFTNNTATNNLANSGGIGIFTIDPNGAIGSCKVLVSGNIANNNESGGVAVVDFMSSHSGSFTEFNGYFMNNTFTNSNSHGIRFAANGDTINIYVQDNTITNNRGDGFAINAGDSHIKNANVTIDNNQLSDSINSANAIDLSAICENLNANITNNTMKNNQGTGILYFNNIAPLPAMTLNITSNTIENNLNVNSNGAGGFSIDGFSSLSAKINNNNLSNNNNSSAIGNYGSSTPAPTGNTCVEFSNNVLTNNETFTMSAWNDLSASACINIHGNNSTTSPSYILSEQSTGVFTVRPSNYDSVNVGDFVLTDVSIADSCGCNH